MLIATKNSSLMDFKNFSAQLIEDDTNPSEAGSHEQLEAFALKLARSLVVEKDLQHGKNLLPEVMTDSEELLNSYLNLTQELSKKVLTPATEWFLDNFHIIEDQLRSIKRDLPKDYYLELPKIKDGEFAGYPRVYAIAHSIVNQSDARLDIENIKKFTASFQTISPLTIGELWAVAITLRISLIKRLLPLVRRIHFSKKQREQADLLADELLDFVVKSDSTPAEIVERLAAVVGQPQNFNRPFIVQLVQRLRDQDPGIFKSMEWLEETLKTCHQSTEKIAQLEHYRQAADQVSIGNIITSMRLFSIIDWHDFFEDVSLVNPLLGQDPEGIYYDMDIATRDSYRKVIERLSRRSEKNELEVTQMALDIAFIETPELTEGHDETYTQPWNSEESATLFEHCARAIDRSLKLGSHGLPLFGSGDWNDGMNRVGHEGKGESVWMSWFLSATLKNFLPSCEFIKDEKRKAIYQEHIHTLKKNTEENAWDGKWYLRAYFDNGEKMGSHENEECQIDAIAQSWAILSGQGDRERVKTALQSVNTHLVKRDQGIIKLFTPPFDKSQQDPGYIKGYLPGVRENGGQYTHAAIWTMMAYAEVGDGDTAEELFSLINPINHAKTYGEANQYKIEPYVIAADIYGLEPHVGRGGWSWYTGSSSWMYRSAVENILGFRIQDQKIKLNPCIPKKWPGFEMNFRSGETLYKIKVVNNSPSKKYELDGAPIDGDSIPLLADGKAHELILHL